MDEMQKRTCCFIGHRKIKDTPELRGQIRAVLSDLIESGTNHFIFGDHSAFNDLCYELVTELKEKYPIIKRIKYRKDYEVYNQDMALFFTEGFEESICPPNVSRAGRASYVKRNQAMIQESEICIFYYDDMYLPPRHKYRKGDQTDYQPKSGTAVAYAYAVQKNKQIINLYRK